MTIFMFDIDETILTTESRLEDLHDDIPRQISKFSPYESLGFNEKCYSLHKEKMISIFKTILQEGHEIGFITAGKIKEKGIRDFIKIEYGIVLDGFIHYREASCKAAMLKTIATDKKCLPKDIYLIDDNPDNIYLASTAGFSTIYVDTCMESRSSGLYIAALEMTLNELQMAAELKAAFIPEKASKFPRIILENKKGAVAVQLAELKDKPIETLSQKNGFFNKSFNFTKCFTVCCKREHRYKYKNV